MYLSSIHKVIQHIWIIFIPVENFIFNIFLHAFLISLK